MPPAKAVADRAETGPVKGRGTLLSLNCEGSSHRPSAVAVGVRRRHVLWRYKPVMLLCCYGNANRALFEGEKRDQVTDHELRSDRPADQREKLCRADCEVLLDLEHIAQMATHRSGKCSTLAFQIVLHG